MIKKSASIILIVCVAFVFSITINGAIKKPSKVKNLTPVKISKTSASFKWKKAKRAKGYSIYLKKNKKFKKIKNTRKNKVKIRKLKPGKKYWVKIKAFGQKKKYGKYSKVIKFRTKKSVIPKKEAEKKKPEEEKNKKPSMTPGWSPEKGFDMFQKEYDKDVCAAYGFGSDGNVLASIKYYKGVDENSADIDKIRGVAEWIADNMSYSYSKTKPRVGICGSYTNLYKHLLTNYFGIDSLYVTSYIQRGIHAWNLVKYNGKWYAVDVTLFDFPFKNEKYDFESFMKSSIYLQESAPKRYSCDWNKETDHSEYECYTIAESTDLDNYDWPKALGYGYSHGHTYEFTCANCGGGENKWEEFPEEYKCPHCGTVNHKKYYKYYPTVYQWVI